MSDETFAALVRDHLVLLRRYAARRVPPDDVEDVVAEVFATAWRHRAKVPDPAKFWLLRTAGFHIQRAYRSRLRENRLADRLAVLRHEQPAGLEEGAVDAMLVRHRPGSAPPGRVGGGCRTRRSPRFWSVRRSPHVRGCIARAADPQPTTPELPSDLDVAAVLTAARNADGRHQAPPTRVRRRTILFAAAAGVVGVAAVPTASLLRGSSAPTAQAAMLKDLASRVAAQSEARPVGRDILYRKGRTEIIDLRTARPVCSTCRARRPVS